MIARKIINTLVFTLILPLVTFATDEKWPKFSCGNVTHQVSPEIYKSLNSNQVQDTDIEMTWIAANPNTNKAYLKGSLEKLNFKSKVINVLNNLTEPTEALEEGPLKVASFTLMPILGTASLFFKTEKASSIKDLICALPEYSIIIFYKGEIILKRIGD